MLAKSRLQSHFFTDKFTVVDNKAISRWQTLFALTFSISLCLGAALSGREDAGLLINPIPIRAMEVETRTVEVVIDMDQSVDTWIAEAVDEFLPTHSSESRMIMHCLAHRESGHGRSGKATDGHGDGGLAGGPFQFHQATWDRMRNQMIEQGLASEVGSRYDFKEAARTTAWAIANGRATEWGPVLRYSKGNNYAACQLPSWYSQQ